MSARCLLPFRDSGGPVQMVLLPCRTISISKHAMQGLPVTAAACRATPSCLLLPVSLVALMAGPGVTSSPIGCSSRSCLEMTVAESQQRPLVGVGVLIFQAGTQRCLVGRRKGAHGGGEWALPGGHLEHGESFEQCASREEETGLELGADVHFAYAVNSVFPSGAHYVTVFCRAEVAADAAPRNMEPHKCEGWEWVEYSRLAQACQPLFLPLAKLLESPYQP